MDKALEKLARTIKLNRRLSVAAGDVYDGGMDDGVVVLDATKPRARCLRVNNLGLRAVRISVDRLCREYNLLGENDAAAVIRTMQRHLAKRTERG